MKYFFPREIFFLTDWLFTKIRVLCNQSPINFYQHAQEVFSVFGPLSANLQLLVNELGNRCAALRCARTQLSFQWRRLGMRIVLRVRIRRYPHACLGDFNIANKWRGAAGSLSKEMRGRHLRLFLTARFTPTKERSTVGKMWAYWLLLAFSGIYACAHVGSVSSSRASG
jgi:hypothetical protein